MQEVFNFWNTTFREADKRIYMCTNGFLTQAENYAQLPLKKPFVKLEKKTQG